MKSLIIYDSYFGNTEKVANAVGKILKGKVVHVSKFKESDLNGVSLLVVGSPTRAFNATPAVYEFIKEINLDEVKVAAFDTRMDAEKAPGLLKFMVNIFGYAAEKILKKLVKRGGEKVGEAAWFFVDDTEGPLRKGELKRAEEWAKKLT